MAEVVETDFGPAEEHQAGPGARRDRRPQRAAEEERSRLIHRLAHRPADWSWRDSLHSLREAPGGSTTRSAQLPCYRRQPRLHPEESPELRWEHRRFGPWRYASREADCGASGSGRLRGIAGAQAAT